MKLQYEITINDKLSKIIKNNIKSIKFYPFNHETLIKIEIDNISLYDQIEDIYPGYIYQKEIEVSDGKYEDTLVLLSGKDEFEMGVF